MTPTNSFSTTMMNVVIENGISYAHLDFNSSLMLLTLVDRGKYSIDGEPSFTITTANI